VIARLLLFAALLPISALAQLQLFVFDGTNETPAGAVLNVGSAGPGDTVTTRFRVRNSGTASATLQSLSLAGTGFTFSAVPSLPYILAPYTGSPVSEVEFDVAFSPTSVASYSAFLAVNTINVILNGTGTPAAVLTLAGSNIPFADGAIIDFGSVPSGATKLLTFDLSNPSGISVTVDALTVTGAGFKGPVGASAPITVAPGQIVSFQIAFQPASGQASQGTLALDQRSFVLTGQGLSPPLPGATIVCAAALPRIGAVLHLRCGGNHRLEDPDKASTSAKIPGKAFAYFRHSRTRIALEQIRSGNQHTRRANAALRAPTGEERLL